jgi:hypothetical protein
MHGDEQLQQHYQQEEEESSDNTWWMIQARPQYNRFSSSDSSPPPAVRRRVLSDHAPSNLNLNLNQQGDAKQPGSDHIVGVEYRQRVSAHDLEARRAAGGQTGDAGAVTSAAGCSGGIICRSPRPVQGSQQQLQPLASLGTAEIQPLTSTMSNITSASGEVSISSEEVRPGGMSSCNNNSSVACITSGSQQHQQHNVLPYHRPHADPHDPHPHHPHPMMMMMPSMPSYAGLDAAAASLAATSVQYMTAISPPAAHNPDLLQLQSGGGASSASAAADAAGSNNGHRHHHHHHHHHQLTVVVKRRRNLPGTPGNSNAMNE